MGKTQLDDVLEHLEKYGSITSMEAITEYGATRLSDIIYRLKKRGYIISTERLTVKTRYGRKTNVGKYTLIKA